MPKNNDQPMDIEVDLLLPIPIVRGSVVGVDIASVSNSDGHYIVDTGRESDRLCQLPSSTNYMTNCSANRTRLVLLIQPLVCRYSFYC